MLIYLAFQGKVTGKVAVFLDNAVSMMMSLGLDCLLIGPVLTLVLVFLVCLYLFLDCAAFRIHFLL